MFYVHFRTYPGFSAISRHGLLTEFGVLQSDPELDSQGSGRTIDEDEVPAPVTPKSSDKKKKKSGEQEKKSVVEKIGSGFASVAMKSSDVQDAMESVSQAKKSLSSLGGDALSSVPPRSM